MSQKELGQYLSVTDKAVSKWERGLSCPDVDNLKNMALLFNKTLSEIIYGTEKDARYSSNLPSDIKKEIMNKNYNCDVIVDFEFASTKYISPFLFGARQIRLRIGLVPNRKSFLSKLWNPLYLSL